MVSSKVWETRTVLPLDLFLPLTCAELSQMTARIRWKLSSVRLSFRSTWQDGCILDLLFNQRLKNCKRAHQTKRLSSFLSRLSMRTPHDISSYFPQAHISNSGSLITLPGNHQVLSSHLITLGRSSTTSALITLPGSHPRSWGGCSCPEQRRSSDLSSSAKSPDKWMSS